MAQPSALDQLDCLLAAALLVCSAVGACRSLRSPVLTDPYRSPLWHLIFCFSRVTYCTAPFFVANGHPSLLYLQFCSWAFFFGLWTCTLASFWHALTGSLLCRMLLLSNGAHCGSLLFGALWKKGAWLLTLGHSVWWILLGVSSCVMTWLMFSRMKPPHDRRQVLLVCTVCVACLTIDPIVMLTKVERSYWSTLLQILGVYVPACVSLCVMGRGLNARATKHGPQCFIIAPQDGQPRGGQSGLSFASPANIEDSVSLAFNPLGGTSDSVTIGGKQWTLSNQLGAGSFGVVRLATCPATGERTACKIVRLCPKSRDGRKRPAGMTEMEQIVNEVTIQKQLDHPCICKVYGWCCDDPLRVHVLLEYLEGGELIDLVLEQGSLNEKQAAQIVENITSAVHYMHTKGVIHRDVKPENVVFASKIPGAQVKLVDFGTAHMMKSGTPTAAVGTMGYEAPEVLNPGLSYDYSADVWSLGCLTYAILSGTFPFSTNDYLKHTNLSKFPEPRFKSQEWVSVSEDAKDFCRRCLSSMPSKRATSADLVSHPFFTNAGSVPLETARVLSKHPDAHRKWDFAPPEAFRKHRLQYQLWRKGDARGAEGEPEDCIHRDDDTEITLDAPFFKTLGSSALAPLSVEDFNRYRSDYRRYRMGEARGAKGEVSGAPTSCDDLAGLNLHQSSNLSPNSSKEQTCF